MRLVIQFRCILFSYLLVIHSVCNLFGSVEKSNRLFDSYDVKFYFINIEANNTNADIIGSTLIMAQLKEDHVDTIGLELSQIAYIDSITLDNKKLEYFRSNDTLKIVLPARYSSGETISLSIFYEFTGTEADLRKGTSCRTIASGAKVTFTSTEPFYAKSWFPCKQYLTDKADSAYIFVTVPDSLMVGSNGILSGVYPVQNNKKRFEWKTRYPIAFYLISFAVANYMDYSFYAKTEDGDSILVQNFIYNDSSYFEKNKKDIDTVKYLIRAFSKRFGPYPFKKEKYGHCIAPSGGGMENQTMTTLSSFGFELVAHELAHSWFGDNVTCSDWQNIWINEGFASYAELIAYEELGTRDKQMEWINLTQAEAKTFADGSIYVPDVEKDNSRRIFDHPLTYKKGALIIHMIRSIINNDEAFFSIIKEYQSKYAYSLASGDDFKNFLEEKTQLDFDYFFQQWYYGEGYPTVTVSWNQVSDSVFLYIEQSTSAPSITPFFNLTMDFRFDYLGGDTTHKLKIAQNYQKLAVPCNQRVYNIVVDPDNWILKNLNGAHRIMPEDNHSYYSIFPNPAVNQVYVQNLDIGKSFQIKIYDLNGILRIEEVGIDAFTLVNLESLEAGVYQVIITASNNSEVYQLVKT
jgi:aminopeptidase N